MFDTQGRTPVEHPRVICDFPKYGICVPWKTRPSIGNSTQALCRALKMFLPHGFYWNTQMAI